MKKIMYYTAIVAVLFAGSAQAAESSASANQVNNANIKSTLNATVAHVQDAVSLTSAAIGNTLTVDGGQAGYVSNTQVFRGDAVAELNGTLNDIDGKVDATAAAIANSGTINVNYAGSISNTQLAGYDPTARLNATGWSRLAKWPARERSAKRACVMRFWISRMGPSEGSSSPQTSRVGTVISPKRSAM